MLRPVLSLLAALLLAAPVVLAQGLSLPGVEPAPAPSPGPAPAPGGSAGGGIAPGKVFRDCADCPEMVAISAGSFQMGDLSGNGYADEKPVHQVTLAGFAAGRYEVTFAEWDVCVTAGGCSHRPDDRGWGRGNRPVIDVSWNDAQAYVRWLSGKTGKSYRLLSEAEWEYAARGGTTTDYWWGSTASTSRANYDDSGHSRSQPAGSYPANPFGLYEVLGNVGEWTQDCWNDSYAGAPSNGAAWTTGDCRNRVLRGGSWSYGSRLLRSAFRYGYSPGIRISNLGFRLARTLP